MTLDFYKTGGSLGGAMEATSPRNVVRQRLPEMRVHSAGDQQVFDVLNEVIRVYSVTGRTVSTDLQMAHYWLSRSISALAQAAGQTGEPEIRNLGSFVKFRMNAEGHLYACQDELPDVPLAQLPSEAENV